jgi:DNA-binding XRE family transcriptional regulator
MKQETTEQEGEGDEAQVEASVEAQVEARSKGGRPRNDPGIGGWSGQALRVRRIVSGVSATKLGKTLGVSQSTVLRWEKELGTPNAPQTRRLAEMLGCDPGDLAREPQVV